MEIEKIEKYDDETLYSMIGEFVFRSKGLSVSEEPTEENKEEGKKWLREHRSLLIDALCGSNVVSVYLSSPEVERRIMIIAAIADLISSIIDGIPAIAVAVLIIREGLESLCGEK